MTGLYEQLAPEDRMLVDEHLWRLMENRERQGFGIPHREEARQEYIANVKAGFSKPEALRHLRDSARRYVENIKSAERKKIALTASEGHQGELMRQR